MNSPNIQSANEIRLQFTQAMSKMYQLEVPLYKKLLSLVDEVNKNSIEDSTLNNPSDALNLNLNLERHGAIRLGQATELSMMRRIFKVMGMQAVDYYDLSVAGIPVHSTAFRAIDKHDLVKSPFRIFCSLLRLDLIENKNLREQATDILNNRQIFPDELLKLVDRFEKQGGLTLPEAENFVKNAIEVFRWHQQAAVDKQTYTNLKDTHGLIADIVSFKGPHINHLTPKVLDIDALQAKFGEHDIKAKTIVEGPPKRQCPILLRQTSFIAVAEDVIFSDGETGIHTARFGEVEQRGIALTRKGRELYDQLLSDARNGNPDIKYSQRLSQAFLTFPDTYSEIRQQKLGFFNYIAASKKIDIDSFMVNQVPDIEALIAADIISVKPITYEDFLPVSAAGIFTSNLSVAANQTTDTSKISLANGISNQKHFEKALGTNVIDSFEIYEKTEKASLENALSVLGYDV